ncbi:MULTISPECIES: hypothetical protein [unclassified Variovorax]|uniref:hypothetical protein n=1 Tax=unclassified Variovorax TaxID=663243 RepID=UPI003F45B362
MDRIDCVVVGAGVVGPAIAIARDGGAVTATDFGIESPGLGASLAPGAHEKTGPKARSFAAPEGAVAVAYRPAWRVNDTLGFL